MALNTDSRIVTLTEAELRLLVKETIHETLTSLGVDHSNPLEMQKDNLFIREQRLAKESIEKKAKLTLLVIALGGLITLVLTGLREYFK